MSPSADSEGDRVFVVRSSDDSGVGVEATGNYVCRAEYEDGGAVEQRLSINVQGVHALYSKVCTI